MVILSTLTFIISTMKEFQAMDSGQTEYTAVVVILDHVDTLVIVFFTLEYLVRFICSPRKWRFFKSPMNLVDLLAIIPFYLTLFVSQLEDIQIIGKAGKIVRLIRVMRILRIFKLVRHFAGLQSLFFTLRQAYKELGLLMLLVAVAILTFSSLVRLSSSMSCKIVAISDLTDEECSTCVFKVTFNDPTTRPSSLSECAHLRLLFTVMTLKQLHNFY